MIAADVALAFNGVNERKSWAARPHAQDGREAVHFTAPANLVTLVLECDTGRFQVRFNKVHAAWGDYVRAIARSLHIVLSTLKAAGQPFDAPEDSSGIDIIATSTDGAMTYVAWPGMIPTVKVPDTLHGLLLADCAGMLDNVSSGVSIGGEAYVPSDAVRDAIMPELQVPEGTTQIIMDTLRDHAEKD